MRTDPGQVRGGHRAEGPIASRMEDVCIMSGALPRGWGSRTRTGGRPDDTLEESNHG
jgi:hypothetical protein